MHGLGRHRRAVRDGRRGVEIGRSGKTSGLRLRSTQNGELSFVQISDSHMGFNKPANPDVVATLKAAVDKINALPHAPEFMLHTGDITHLSKPEEFDNVDQILKSAKQRDFLCARRTRRAQRRRRERILERYGKGSKGQDGTASTRKACTSSAW